MVEYRISKRVKEQFGAFMEGLLELIPSDLISVFDERELELLIGGMAEIDMYVSFSFSSIRFLNIHLTGTIGPSSPTTEGMTRRTKLSNGFGNVYAHGRLNASRDCCNLQRELLVYP